MTAVCKNTAFSSAFSFIDRKEIYCGFTASFDTMQSFSIKKKKQKKKTFHGEAAAAAIG